MEILVFQAQPILRHALFSEASRLTIHSSGRPSKNMNGRGGSVLKSRNMGLMEFGIVEGGDETLRAVLLAYTSRALESLVLLKLRIQSRG
jgi:hypothetical protein